MTVLALAFGCAGDTAMPGEEGTGSSGQTDDGGTDADDTASDGGDGPDGGDSTSSATDDGTGTDADDDDDTGSSSSGGSGFRCSVPETHETIQLAVDDPACTIISVAPGTYAENVVIDRGLELRATENGAVTIDGAGAGRVVDITTDMGVTLRGLVITGGLAETGAGVASAGDVELQSCTIQGNDATQGSAGIYTAGMLLAIDSTIDDNVVLAVDEDAYGGGAFAVGGATLSGVTITNNAIDLQLVAESFVGASGGGLLASGPVTISGETTISGNSITIAGVNGAASGGGLAVSDSVTIGAGTTVADNVISVSTDGELGPAEGYGAGLAMSFGDVSITGATVTGNTVVTDSSGSISYGGGIFAAVGTLTLSDSTVSANSVSATSFAVHAFARGGGVYCEGDFDLDSSIISNNTTSGSATQLRSHGAGAYLTGGVVTTDSTFVGNMANDGGARGGALAIYDSAGNTAELRRTTFSGNGAVGTTAFGGAIVVDGNSAASPTSVHVINSTISGNLADGPTLPLGGGIAVLVAVGATAELHLASSTLTLNDAGDGTPAGNGGGLWTQTFGATVHSRNTIIQGNVAAQSPDCSTPDLTSSGYNLIGSATGCTITGGPDQIGEDPALVALADNGGPTETHALSSGTPAVDAGDPTGCTDTADVALTTDQRGDAREVGAACDVGAFELQ